MRSRLARSLECYGGNDQTFHLVAPQMAKVINARCDPPGAGVHELEQHRRAVAAGVA